MIYYCNSSLHLEVFLLRIMINMQYLCSNCFSYDLLNCRLSNYLTNKTEWALISHLTYQLLIFFVPCTVIAVSLFYRSYTDSGTCCLISEVRF